jgi:hypothetical protein
LWCDRYRTRLLAPGIASLESRKAHEIVEGPSDTATKAPTQTHATGSVTDAKAFGNILKRRMNENKITQIWKGEKL